MRISLAVPLASVLVIAITAAPAAAQLLVQPVRATGSYSYTAIRLPQAPIFSSDLEEHTTPGGFGAGNSGSTGQGQPLSTISFGAQYDITNFFQFPIGDVNTIEASGFADAGFEIADGADVSFASTAISSSIITFLVTEPVIWTGTGSLTVSNALASGDGLGVVGAHFQLRRGIILLQTLAIDTFAASTTPISLGGELTPGEYTLSLSANASTTSTAPGAQWRARAEYDLHIDFTPVPSPGTAIALTLAGAAGLRRRRG